MGFLGHPIFSQTHIVSPHALFSQLIYVYVPSSHYHTHNPPGLVLPESGRCCWTMLNMLFQKKYMSLGPGFIRCFFLIGFHGVPKHKTSFHHPAPSPDRKKRGEAKNVPSCWISSQSSQRIMWFLPAISMPCRYGAEDFNKGHGQRSVHGFIMIYWYSGWFLRGP